MNENLKEKLQAIIKSNPMNYGQVCASKAYFELAAQIKKATSALDQTNCKFRTRIFWILHDIADFPKCCICGKPVMRDIKTLATGYNKIKLWEESDIFNVSCECEECVKKRRMAEAEKTFLRKYGVKNPYQAECIKEKITKTNLEKYGCVKGGNSEQGRHKARQTWIRKYGVDSPLKSADIKAKVKNTCIKKYGVESYTQTDEYKRQHAAYSMSKMLERIKEDPEITFMDFSEFDQISSTSQIWDVPITCACKICGTQFKSKLGFNNFYKYGTVSSCPKCHPTACSSKAENDIFKLVCEYVDESEIIRNSRKIIPHFELDMYIPSRKIAIEFDGLFWHSSKAGIPYDYHLKKTEECERLDIQLLHIFEDEWHFKKDIVKSRIANILGVYEKTIYARKCDIAEVDSATANAFLQNNHIQGIVNSKVRIGLFFKGKLVSLMTFGKSRFSKKYEWEMLRFCSKLGLHVPGAAGKMLSYFEKTYNPKSLVSYADRRWSRGRLYKALGFRLDHISRPDYRYWNYKKSGFMLESRIKYQKHKLSKLLKKFDPSKTEIQNMNDNDFYQVYDCGNLVFLKEYHYL